MKWQPHEYQKTALAHLLSRKSAALFLDPGLGKTSIVLSGITGLIKKHRSFKALLIAPLRVCENVWPNEIKKWDQFNHLTSVFLHGDNKEDLLAEPADIYLINPEGLDWLLDGVIDRKNAQTNLERWNSLGFTALIVDEVSFFKDKRSNRWRFLDQVAGTFKYRWGLTGSPAPNDSSEVWAQCFLLDGGETLGRDVRSFRKRYCENLYKGTSLPPKWVITRDGERMIRLHLPSLAIAMKAEDYLQMPTLIHRDISVVVPDHAREAYASVMARILRKFQIAVEDNMNTGANVWTPEQIELCEYAAVNNIFMKGRQISGGAMYDVSSGTLEDTDKVIHYHDEKINALLDLIDALDNKPLLVSYQFQHELSRIKSAIKERFGFMPPHIGSGVSLKKTDEIIEQWNNRELRVLLGQPASMGHGLNLQLGGSNICWFSLTWSFENYEQFNRRLYRQGNPDPVVTVYHILADLKVVTGYGVGHRNSGGTAVIDKLLLATIQSKCTKQNALIDSIKKLIHSQ